MSITVDCSSSRFSRMLTYDTCTWKYVFFFFTSSHINNHYFLKFKTRLWVKWPDMDFGWTVNWHNIYDIILYTWSGVLSSFLEIRVIYSPRDEVEWSIHQRVYPKRWEDAWSGTKCISRLYINTNRFRRLTEFWWRDIVVNKTPTRQILPPKTN